MQTTIDLKFKQSKKEMIIGLWIGVLWTLLFLAKLVYNDEPMEWFDWGTLLIGLSYFGLYLLDRNKSFDYRLTTSEIIKNQLLNKKSVSLANLTVVKEFAGEYIFRASDKEIRIPYKSLEDESRAKLQEFIEEKELLSQKMSAT